jgi:hypothetical protein
MCVHAADVVIANQRSPNHPLFVQNNGAAATLWNCDFYALNAALQSAIAINIQPGELAGVMLKNTTYTNSLFRVHVEATSDAEVYSDNEEIVFRHFQNGSEPVIGGNGKLDMALNLSDSSASMVQFISASDLEDLIKVCLFRALCSSPSLLLK